MYRKWLIILVILMAFSQGANGITLSISGEDGKDIGSVSISIDVEDDAAVSGGITIDGADLRPTTKIKGRTKAFEQTHIAKDKSGKTAQTYAKVVNAPSDMSYSSQILPDRVKKKITAPWIAAEQSLTVSKADSVIAKASASYGTLSSDVGIEIVKGPLPTDFVTLTNYYGKAYASDGSDSTIPFGTGTNQTAVSGTGNSIRIYGHASDGNGSLGVDTSIDGLSLSDASFQHLDAGSNAGIGTKVTQKAHVTGKFTSVATAGTESTTRASNYGTEYDLDMQTMIESGLPGVSGILGYYVDDDNPNANLIQGAVDAAEFGDDINVLPGTYFENVAIEKSLDILGAGADKTVVDGNQKGSTFKIGEANSEIDVKLSGLAITNGTGIIYLSGDSYRGGGGVYNKGKATIENCLVSRNSADRGGGVLNLGTATITGSEVSENLAGCGAGIYNLGVAGHCLKC